MMRAYAPCWNQESKTRENECNLNKLTHQIKMYKRKGYLFAFKMFAKDEILRFPNYLLLKTSTKKYNNF
jgi:hypothetical protein